VVLKVLRFRFWVLDCADRKPVKVEEVKGPRVSNEGLLMARRTDSRRAANAESPTPDDWERQGT
jgi:hypothetical protein